MDFATTIDTRTDMEDAIIADKRRLSAFKLGKSSSSPSLNTHQAPHKPAHARSHSRTTSVSILSLSSNELPIPTADSPPLSPSRSSLGASKRNSHHRRRSSVSTRIESAEMMGVSLPVVPASVSDENLNLGDKDSIRRRALWALEGKNDVGTFSKVEIPELHTPEIEKGSYEFPSKPSFPPGIGAGYGTGMMGSKRESFKFMASSSTKEQLHTLIEEEEEEEEGEQPDATATSRPRQDLVASPIEETSTGSSLARHRPATLNLRPLSLAASVQVTTDLPTPSPSPNPRPGLKSLTLASAAVSDSSVTTSVARKRQSLVLSPSPTPPSAPVARKPSLPDAIDTQTPSIMAPSVARRSSISYFTSADTPACSSYGLPTPEMTPTTERHTSVGSTDSDISRLSRSSRPLSTSEQHFLFQSHALLVQRISDLERALTSRPRSSRPPSCASDGSAPNEPSDEMLQLIADLKSERDELKRDVDGWRNRVADLQKQVDLLFKRVDAERREAWVARERAGLLEMEKSSLEKSLAENSARADAGWKKYEEAKTATEKAQEECRQLHTQTMKVARLETECVDLKAALAEERRRREELERELEVAGLLATPTPRAFEMKMPNAAYSGPISRTMMLAKRSGLGFRSVDSSCTDVESVDGSIDRHNFVLKAVEEEEEDDSRDESMSDCSDEDNELSRYEEEDENDVYMLHTSFSGSSIASNDEFPRSTDHFLNTSAESVPDLSCSRSNSSSPPPLPTPKESAHARRASLSKTWTFPHASDSSPALDREPEEIDRFFGCLEDVDNSPPLGSKLRSVESGKNLFALALEDEDEDLPPFVLPMDVGVEVISPVLGEPKPVLAAVLEEEEEEEEEVDEDSSVDDEFVGEEVDGGIIFTFTPPPNFDEDAEADVSMASVADAVSAPSDEDEAEVTCPHDKSEDASSPSSIPRPMKSFTSLIPVGAPSTPVKSASFRFPKPSGSPTFFSTPPPKRGTSPSPTSIPVLRSKSSSPSDISTPSKCRPPSFIPQPKRSPVSPSPVISKIPVSPISSPARSQAKPAMSILDDPVASQSSASHSELKSGALADPSVRSALPVSDLSPSSPPNFMSPTLAARLSFQTLTNFIPMPSLPWSPRSPVLGTAASAAAAALCIIPPSSSSSSDEYDGPSSFVNCSTALQRPTPSLVAGHRGYVSKEKQLEKLRIRLEEEKRMQVRGRAIATPTPFTQEGTLQL